MTLSSFSLSQKAHDILKKAWNAKGSPFKGTPFDPSRVQLQGHGKAYCGYTNSNAAKACFVSCRKFYKMCHFCGPFQLQVFSVMINVHPCA